MPINRRILVLDDEPGILDAYRAIFSPPAAKTVRSSRGSAAAALAPVVQEWLFEVSYARTGAECLRLIESSFRAGKPFVGGFFDVKLGPGIDGLETLRRARELDPDFLCVITTAYQDRSVEEITNILGKNSSDCWDFLNKPFTHSEIMQKAQNLSSNWDRRKRECEHLAQIEDQQDLLLQSERLAAVGTLARGIGHEFGNVLMRIVGKAELSLINRDPAEMEEALKKIVEASLRAGVIVRNLQSYSKVTPTFEKGSLLDPLQDSLSLISHELKGANITIEERLEPNLPSVMLSRVEMGQVFLNLFINAKHAMEATGGTLTLSAKSENGGLVVSVADSGCGIAKENLTKIFEHLFTTKGERGSGIGLSVSKVIVEKHKGTLKVTSEIGKGTTFHVWIPAA